MNLEDAKQVADDVCKTFEPYFQQYMVVGSIRRKQAEVKDIDIVAIPLHKEEWFLDKIQELINALDPTGQAEAKALGKSGISRFSKGNKIKRFRCEGEMVDLYIADNLTYETLVLIRTGSEQHNIKLTTEAQKRGLKLFANGRGLWRMNDGVLVGDELVALSEKDILVTLLGKYVEPEERI